jgi:hypothetical protein
VSGHFVVRQATVDRSVKFKLISGHKTRARRDGCHLINRSCFDTSRVDDLVKNSSMKTGIGNILEL